MKANDYNFIGFQPQKSTKVITNIFNTLKSLETKEKLLTFLQSHTDDEEQSQYLAHEGSHHHLLCLESEVQMRQSNSSKFTHAER